MNISQIEFKPTITLGALMQILIVLAGGAGLWTAQVSKAAVLEEKIAQVEKLRLERNAEVDGQINEIKTALQSIDNKLTRILINERSTVRTQ